MTVHALDYYQSRRDLACAFRWAARLNMHEAVANHFSLSISEDGQKFLINRKGSDFSRIRASDLLIIESHTDGTSPPEEIDPTAWALHSAIHRTNTHATCVLHVHSKYATALACLADSTLPPIDQNSMRFFERVSIDDHFEGMGLGNEAERVASHCTDRPILLLGNHGVMVIGPTVAQAFDDLYYFERACETYLCVLSTGRPLRVVSEAIARKTSKQWAEDFREFAEWHFSALRQILDAEEPAYAE